MYGIELNTSMQLD